MPRPWLTQELIERARALVQGGAGRHSLMDALNLSEEKARALLHAVKQTGAPAVEPDPIVPPTSELATAISDSIRALPALQVKRVVRKVDPELDEEDVILHVSDCHVGSLVSATQTGGLGHYDFEVFTERMERLCSGVAKILRYTPNPVKRVHLVLGGDIIDGSTIFCGHQRQIDLPVVQQVIHAYEAFVRLILDLRAMFDEVVVSGVPGNHARIGLKGELAPNDNLDYLMMHFLRERFQLSEIAGVRFNLPETWWMLLEAQGWRFLVAHGDEFRSWLRIPFYGALGFKARMREVLKQAFKKVSGESVDFDYVMVAHHHEPASFSDIFMNGSFVGGSEFSLKRLQAGGLPFQRILGVHRNIGVSWDRKLILADRRELPEPTIYQ